MGRMETRHQIKKQKLEEENRKRRKEDLERAKTMFVRKDKVVRKNDMITDPAAKKIKLEPEQNSNSAVVKQDVESGERCVQLDTMEGGDGPGTVVNVPEEVTPEDMELEEGVEFVTVEEKVDLSDEDEACSSAAAVSLSSLRNVVFTVETLQKKNEKLKTLLKQRDAELGNVNAQLEESVAEIETLRVELEHIVEQNKQLAYQRSQAEADRESEIINGENLKGILQEKGEELESQNNIIRSLRVQLKKMTDLLEEKTAEVISEAKISDSLRSQMARMKELSDGELANLRKALQRENIEDGEGISDQRTEEENTTDDVSFVVSKETVALHFQDVLKIFIRWQGKEHHLVNWTKVTPMLKICRLVCKSWKQSVNFILEQDSSHVSLFGTRNYLDRFANKFCPLPLLLSRNNLNPDNANASCWNLGNFLEQPERVDPDPAYNPLPTRFVKIWHDAADGWDWKDISQLAIKYLYQFGKQVWYLIVDIGTSKLSPPLALTVHQSLREILELLPNLRCFGLRVRYDHSFKDTDSKLEQVSFPHLKHLETFHCYGNADLFHCILANNQHIQRLAFPEDSIHIGTAFTQAQSLIKKINFQNLSEVSCHVHFQEEPWKKCLNASLILESLSLGLHYHMRHPVEDLFQGLESVTKTLKFLTIDSRLVPIRVPADWKVNLPQLRGLHVISKDWEPMDWIGFLVQLENLETFTMELIKGQNPTVAQKRTFLQYINTFYKKDGWAKLPKLKHVTMTVCIYNGYGKIQQIGKPFQVWVKRSKNNVLKFDLVSIEDKDIA